MGRFTLNSLTLSIGISHRNLYFGYLTRTEFKAAWHSCVLILYSLEDKLCDILVFSKIMVWFNKFPWTNSWLIVWQVQKQYQKKN